MSPPQQHTTWREILRSEAYRKSGPTRLRVADRHSGELSSDASRMIVNGLSEMPREGANCHPGSVGGKQILQAPFTGDCCAVEVRAGSLARVLEARDHWLRQIIAEPLPENPPATIAKVREQNG